MGYAENRAFSDSMIRHVENFLKQRHGFQYVDITNNEMDMHQSADLIGMRGKKEITVAYRIRKYDYFNDYSNQITIRYRSSGGGKSEYRKIMEGKGDWMMYVFASPDMTTNYKYALLKLDGVRHRAKQITEVGMARREKKNKKHNGAWDGTSFVFFNFGELPQDCLIASNHITKDVMVPRQNVLWLDDYCRHLDDKVNERPVP